MKEGVQAGRVVMWNDDGWSVTRDDSDDERISCNTHTHTHTHTLLDTLNID